MQHEQVWPELPCERRRLRALVPAPAAALPTRGAAPAGCRASQGTGSTSWAFARAPSPCSPVPVGLRAQRGGGREAGAWVRAAVRPPPLRRVLSGRHARLPPPQATSDSLETNKKNKRFPSTARESHAEVPQSCQGVFSPCFNRRGWILLPGAAWESARRAGITPGLPGGCAELPASRKEATGLLLPEGFVQTQIPGCSDTGGSRPPVRSRAQKAAVGFVGSLLTPSPAR